MVQFEKGPEHLFEDKSKYVCLAMCSYAYEFVELIRKYQMKKNF